MKETKVASRYAKSLLDLAIEQNSLEEAYADMRLVLNAVEENRDLELLLLSPIVKTDKKLAILDKVFAGQLHKVTAEFLKIITRKKREYLIGDIAQSFVLKYKAHKGILTAEVTTAVPLDDLLRSKVEAIVKKLNHREIELIEKVDPELVGGLVLRVGDKQVDASVSRMINDLKLSFSKNPYIAEF